MEPKGSLFLRSNHMNYSRTILNSNWHQARESEPKDYDINYDNARNLTESTYKRIASVTDGTLPATTYMDHCAQLLTKPDYEETPTKHPMVNVQTIGHANIDRDTGKPKRGYGSVLPRHHPDHNKFHLETTHLADFKPPYEYVPAEFVAVGRPPRLAPIVYTHSHYNYHAMESEYMSQYVPPCTMELPGPYRPLFPPLNNYGRLDRIAPLVPQRSNETTCTRR